MAHIKLFENFSDPSDSVENIQQLSPDDFLSLLATKLPNKNWSEINEIIETWFKAPNNRRLANDREFVGRWTRVLRDADFDFENLPFETSAQKRGRIRFEIRELIDLLTKANIYTDQSNFMEISYFVDPMKKAKDLSDKIFSDLKF